MTSAKGTLPRGIAEVGADASSHVDEPRLWQIAIQSGLLMFALMAIVRWLPAHVPLITFHANVLLAGASAGMACGLASTSQINRRRYLSPVAAFLLFVFSRFAELIHERGIGWNTAGAKDVFFGLARTTGSIEGTFLPLEALIVIVFALVALTFVESSRWLGFRMAHSHHSVSATYGSHLAGCIGGVLLFGLVGALRLPAPWWLLLAVVGLASTDRQTNNGRRYARRAVLIWALAFCAALVDVHALQQPAEEIWSPYYRVQLDPGRLSIRVNMVSHQQMVAGEGDRLAYALPYLLRRDAGYSAPQAVGVIGAGTGNDVSHALAFGAGHVSAVELDPVLAELGQRHPDRPYADPRTDVVVADGRRFLQRTERRFDVLIYGFVDSLISQSSFGSLRFESYLYTAEAWAQARKSLKADGQLIIYEYFRTGWALGRLVAALDREFGAGSTVVLTLPQVGEVSAEDSMSGVWSIVIAGDTALLRKAFAQHKIYYWRHGRTQPGVNGFRDAPQRTSTGITPVSETRLACCMRASAVDDSWPFPYARLKALGTVPWRMMALVIGSAFVIVVCLFGASSVVESARRPRIYGPLFCLGCAFMLLEARLIAIAATAFGTTYVVTTIVVGSVLLASLVGVVLYGGGRSGRRLSTAAGIAIALGLSACGMAVIPAQRLLAEGGPAAWITMAAMVGPVALSGSVFTHYYDRADRSTGLAVNGLGVVVGSQLENLVLVFGNNGLGWLVAGLYIVVAAGLLASMRSHETVDLSIANQGDAFCEPANRVTVAPHHIGRTVHETHRS